MKKIVAIMLALALVFAMSTIAFAASTATISGTAAEVAENDSADVDVLVKLNNGSLPEDPEDVDPDGEDAVYKVDIDASGAVFTYTFDSNYNTGTHQYEDGSWDKTDDVIAVTNHSNTSITVTAAFKVGDSATTSTTTATKNNVTATLSNVSFDLASAVNSGSNPPSNNVSVEISDTIPTVFSGEFVLDQVTITIAGKAA